MGRAAVALYGAFLRLPRFRGHGRLDAILRPLLLPRPTTRVDGGLLMELDPLEWPQAQILRDGCLEPRTVALMRRLLAPGDHAVDVGAHVGFHTLVAASCVGPKGRVLAVEPQPANAGRLLKNAGLNAFTNVDLVVAAAGATCGHVVLRDQAETDRSRLTLDGAGVNDGLQRFRVPLLTLEVLLAEHRMAEVALLKVDVEGFESQVLAGLGAGWAGLRHVILEVLGAPDRIGDDARRALADLRARGYAIADVEGSPWDADRPLLENNVWARRTGARPAAS